MEQQEWCVVVSWATADMRIRRAIVALTDTQGQAEEVADRLWGEISAGSAIRVCRTSQAFRLASYERAPDKAAKGSGAEVVQLSERARGPRERGG